jgi:hypothetical protein
MKISMKGVFVVVLLIGIGLLFTGTSLYWIGYHTFDLGHNLAYINSETDAYFMDINSKGNIETTEEMIPRGLRNMNRGLRLIFMSSLMIGLMIPLAIYWEDD